VGDVTHAEISRRGGASKSAAKTAAVRRNLKNAQAALKAKREALSTKSCDAANGVRLRVHTILGGQFIKAGTPIEEHEVPDWLLKYREPAQAQATPPAPKPFDDSAKTHEDNGQTAAPMRIPREEWNPGNQAPAIERLAARTMAKSTQKSAPPIANVPPSARTQPRPREEWAFKLLGKL
jgi:hypothetical protein